MLPGAGDLALGVDFVKQMATEHSLPYVAANLVCDGAAPFPATRVVEHGGTTIGFIGVEGQTIKTPGCSATDPVEAVKTAAASLHADVIVVLSGEKVDDDRALAQAVPSIAMIVNGQERKQYTSPEALPNGGLLLASGSRMKQVGVLGFTLTPGATAWRDDATRGRLADERDRQKSRLDELKKKLADAADDKARDHAQHQVDFYTRELAKTEDALEKAVDAKGPAHVAANRLVDLGTDLADDPATADLVTKAKAAIAALEPPKPSSAIVNGPYVGSAVCAGCHAVESAQWKATPHAHAYASLENVQRAKDRECFECHVTGAHDPDGPQDPGSVMGLENVGCEACHGPGKAHAQDPKVGTMTKTPGVEVCTSCHDGSRDIEQDGTARFDAATYMPKVMHKGSDQPSAVSGGSDQPSAISDQPEKGRQPSAVSDQPGKGH
jgi:hypothetical protein